jgi:hypothetical protein
VRAPLGRRVVRGSDGDEDSVDILMAEAQLEELVWAFDEEGSVRMHDRPHPLQSQATGKTDHQLLADADVDHALRVAADGTAFDEAGDSDVCENHHHIAALVEQVGGRLSEALPHRVHHAPRGTRATTA